MGTSHSVLPREFHKNLFEDFSRDFLLILLVSLAVHVGTVLLLSNRLVTSADNRQGIEQIQKRFASLILQDKEVFERRIDSFRSGLKVAESKEESTRPEVVGHESIEQDAVGEGLAEGKPGEEAGAAGMLSEARRRTRDQIAQEVRSKGILGLITSGGGTETASEIDQLLGIGERERDLDEVLSGLSGVRSRESAGGDWLGVREVRGARTTEGGRLDALVTELGDAQATNITRMGDLVVGPVTPLTKEGEVAKWSGRNPDDVSAVVNSHNDAIEYCYQKELKRNPNLKGKLVLRFTITTQGTVKDVTVVSSTLNDESLERCIVRRIQRWDDFGVVAPSLGEATFRQVYTFGF